MKFFLASCVSLVSFFSLKSDGVSSANDDHKRQDGFAVIELFTSEGCSSCPAADEAVAEIQKKYNSNVHVLCFHVDYWNYLGWKDEYSDAVYSERQQRYASAFGLQSIYTPQAIVNGEKEFVGSDRALLSRSVEKALSNDNEVHVKITAETDNGKPVKVNYEAPINNSTELNIALIQLNAETEVKRGENKGRILKHINIVRAFRSILLNKAGNGTLEFEMPAVLTKLNCKIIAYLQDLKTLKISGVTEAMIK